MIGPLFKKDLEEIFNHSQESFSSLQGKHIFLTGATGFFGKWLVEAFEFANLSLPTPIKITSVSRTPENFYHQLPHFKSFKNFSLLKGDLTSASIALNNINLIIHAASDVRTSIPQEEEASYLEHEEKILNNVLKVAKENPVERLLFISSGAIYGQKTNEEPLPTESDPIPELVSAYAKAKNNSEKEIADFCDKQNIPYNIARSFAFIGPHLPLDGSYAAGNFLLSAINNNEIIIKGDGTPLRSYLYMTDLIKALILLLTTQHSGETFNIGHSLPTSIKELAEAVSGRFSNIPIKVLGESKKNSMVLTYVPNIEKARKLLNWSPSVDLEESRDRFKSWVERS